MKQWAAALLLAALAGIALTYAANQKSVGIQGPGALQAATTETVWLGVDEELWVLDRAGRRTLRRTAGELGLSEAVSNIVPAPGGQVILTSRGDPFWQVVDARTLAPVRTIRPHWPAEFAGNYLRAIHLAVAPDGDIAVATGGGHAVLLFDAQGRFKARSTPSLYRFTNGLWWSPEGWWTTDTNRFALHLLDARSMAPVRSVSLSGEPAGFPFLGEAQASRGRPAANGAAPLATLTRVGHLMEPGHVVDVFEDGTQLLFNRAPFSQLRDIAWFDERLLAVDGGSFTLQRFGADRIHEGVFGDAQVRAELQQRLQDRHFWRTLGSRYAFALSALLLLAGIGAHVRHKRLAALDLIAQREGGQAVATPAPVLQRMRWRGIPLVVRTGAFLFIVLVVYPWLSRHLLARGASPAAVLGLLLAIVVVLEVIGGTWQELRRRRLARDPAWEAALNDRAIQWLRAHDDFDRVRLPDESPRETIVVESPARWLLVTNRRVLLFVTSAHERRLVSEWPRRMVVFAGAPAGIASPNPGQRLLRALRGCNLAITFATGTTIQLRCASDVTAARVAQLLMSSPYVPDDQVSGWAPMPVPEPVPRRRWHEVLASLLVPGTGQWLQGRFTTGTVLFTGAALMGIFVAWPVLWALRGPKMDVPAFSIFIAALGWMLLALMAGGDAWRFSATRAARTG